MGKNPEDGSPAPETKLTAKHAELVDLVLDDDGSVAFLVSGENDPEVKPSIDEEGTTWVPPEREHIPFSLVDADKVIDAFKNDTDEKLFDDLVSYHHGISDLPDAWYRILAAWDMHTWILEKFNYSPIMCFCAVAERGKTRTTRGMVYVAYRAITTESLRESYLIRVTDSYDATICFDVMDMSKKAHQQGSEDVILLRFDRGARVPRVNRPEAGRYEDIDYYDIFGPTIIATNEYLDHILDTRAITCTMQDSTRDFPDDVTEKTALPLKARLTAFRARHMTTQLQMADKPSSGRLGDILRPFRQIIKLVKPAWEDEFMSWVEDVKNERTAAKQDTSEGQLLKAVQANLGNRLPDDRMFVSDVTVTVNSIRYHNKQLQPAFISGKLRGLGFRRGTKTSKGNTIECSDDVFYQIADKYGIKIEAHDKGSDQDEDVPEPIHATDHDANGFTIDAMTEDYPA